MQTVEAVFSISSLGDRAYIRGWNAHTASRVADYCFEHSSNTKHFFDIGSECIMEGQEGSARINIIPLNGYKPKSRLVAPGKVNTLAVTKDQRFVVFCVGEKIYFYQTSTGILRTVGNSHFQPITTIKFNKDGCIVACGGKDGIVSLWRLSSLCNLTHEKEALTPMRLFTDHTLPVNDVIFSILFSRTIVATVSDDKTAKVYFVDTGDMMLSVAFDNSLNCITIPNNRKGFLVGQQNGTITNISFSKFKKIRVSNYLDIIEADDSFSGHTQAIICIAVTRDNSHLISSSIDSTIRIWDVETQQCLHLIQEKGPIYSMTIAHLPYRVFRQKFKPKLIFRPFILQNDFKSNFIEVNTTTEIPSPQTLLSLMEGNSETFKNSNKTLYSFSLNKYVNQVSCKSIQMKDMNDETQVNT